MSADLDLAADISEFMYDPLGFVMFAFPWGEPGGPMAAMQGPYKWQIEYLKQLGEIVRRNGFNGVDPVPPVRMSRSTGHGVGKSVMCAWLTCWIMSTRPHCKGTVTANTVTQLETKTWATIQVWMSRCITSHWFDVTQTRISHRQFRSSWFVSAQTCREENSEAFAGQHAADSTSFYIKDEASAIPDKIWEVAEGGLIKGEPMIFAFGNPTRNTGKFFRINFGSEMARWNHGCLDSRDADAGQNAETIQAWLEEWGEDSDFFRVRVRGMAPRASDLQFISSALVQEARRRSHVPLDDDPLVVGVDVANGGMAKHTIVFRRGLDAKSIAPILLKGDVPRGSLVSQLATILGDRTPGRRVAAMFIDQAFGAVIVNMLMNLGFTNVFEVNFGSEAPSRRHYANMRAYMWWTMREWLNLGAISDSDDLELDLTGPGAENRPNGQLVLESKADMAKRGVKSPDWADGLALTFARPVAPVATQSSYQRPMVVGGAWS